MKRFHFIPRLKATGFMFGLNKKAPFICSNKRINENADFLERFNVPYGKFYLFIRLNEQVKPMEHKKLEKILKALANRRRLAIVNILKNVHEAYVGYVAEKIGLSFAATSRHLVIMERAGVLEKTQRDKKVFYRLAEPMESCIAKIIKET